MLMSTNKYYFLYISLLCVFFVQSSDAVEVSGRVGLEYSFFTEPARFENQHRGYASFVAEPEFYQSWNDDQDRITFSPFLRYQQHDDERRYLDIRGLYWLHVADEWELRLGIHKVFWGVTESLHLVDIINQTDYIENINAEAKLGQPMLEWSVIQDWGVLDLFLMPYFRERTFTGIKGRFRPQLAIDTDSPSYESSQEQKHLDIAARWYYNPGDSEVAISYFSGTSREPVIGLDMTGGQPSLTPYYPLIEQWGLEYQLTRGNWIWKLEAIHRQLDKERFASSVGGFEYTFYGIMSSNVDVGVLAEYLYNNEKEHAPTAFQNDSFVGFRIAFNNIKSTELLFGAIVDNDDQGQYFLFEASHRLTGELKLTIEGQAFNHIADSDPYFGSIHQDDYISIEISKYF